MFEGLFWWLWFLTVSFWKDMQRLYDSWFRKIESILTTLP